MAGSPHQVGTPHASASQHQQHAPPSPPLRMGTPHLVGTPHPALRQGASTDPPGAGTRRRWHAPPPPRTKAHDAAGTGRHSKWATTRPNFARANCRTPTRHHQALHCLSRLRGALKQPCATSTNPIACQHRVITPGCHTGHPPCPESLGQSSWYHGRAAAAVPSGPGGRRPGMGMGTATTEPGRTRGLGLGRGSTTTPAAWRNRPMPGQLPGPACARTL